MPIEKKLVPFNVRHIDVTALAITESGSDIIRALAEEFNLGSGLIADIRIKPSLPHLQLPKSKPTSPDQK